MNKVLFGGNSQSYRSFKLNSNKKYTIKRVQGDASGYEIKIATDKHGVIVTETK